MKRLIAVATIAAPLLFSPQWAHAKDSCDIVIRYDQIKRTAEKDRGGKTTAVSTKKPLELKTNDAVCFEVVGTSTAVWQWDVNFETIDTLGRGALETLTAAAGPYAFDIARQLQGVADDSKTVPEAFRGTRGAGAAEVQAAYVALAAEIARLGTVIEKLEDVAFRADNARVQMAIEPAQTDVLAKTFAESLASDLRCVDRSSTAADCRKELKVLGELASVSLDVQKRGHELAVVAAKYPEESPDEVEKIQKQWAEIRGGFSDVLGAARDTDELVQLVTGAKGSWKSRAFKASWSSGYLLALTAESREGTVAAPAPPPPMVIKLVRKNAVHLSGGFAMVYSPDSLFDQYEVVEDEVTAERTIALAGESDQRITEALVMGMTMDRLDWRETNGFAIWIPQLVIAPSPGVGALGVGAGASWHMVGLSGGAVWHRQDVLVRQKVGDILATGETLHVRSNAYDWERPRWYVSLSINAPFGGPGDGPGQQRQLRENPEDFEPPP